MRPQDITQIRQLAGLSQTQFAKLLGFSRLTVNKWERGNAQPKKKSVKKIESLIGSDNLRVIQSKLLYDLSILEASESLRKRIREKGEVKR